MPNFDKYYTSYDQLSYDEISPPRKKGLGMNSPVPSFLQSSILEVDSLNQNLNQEDQFRVNIDFSGMPQDSAKEDSTQLTTQTSSQRTSKSYPSTGTIAKHPFKNKIEEAYGALLDWGYSPALASGILGNAWLESKFNINAGGDGKENGVWKALGWFQMWKTERLNYSAWKSRNASKIKGLPEHVTQSLYVADAVTNRKKDYGITQDLNSMTDPAQIAVIVSNQYERPKKEAANNKERQNYAISLYKYFNTPQMKLGGMFDFIHLNYL